MKRPLKQIPVFRQQPGESQKRFFNRMERTAKAVIERSRYEDKYGVEVTQDEVTGQTSVRDREKDEVELAKEQASTASGCEIFPLTMKCLTPPTPTAAVPGRRRVAVKQV